MSRTKRKYKGIEYPDSSRKRRKDKRKKSKNCGG